MGASKDPVIAEDIEKSADAILVSGDAVEIDSGSIPMKANGATATSDEATFRRRLWFVRVPKPPEVAAIKALDVEVETYKAQFRLLTESLNVKRLERDGVRDNLRTAREAMRRCREAFDAKNAVVEPLRESLRAGGAASRKMREEYAELDARTEAELDAKLADLNHRIEHETITLREEKAIVAMIKKLQMQRPRIRDLEASAGAVAETRADTDRLKAELAEHDAELRVLRTERETQAGILAKFKEQEAAIDAQVEGILTERKRVKELQDAAYARVSEVRRVQKARNDAYYANRRFSRAVRSAVASGDVAGAVAMCHEQMQQAHEKLLADDDYRAEYFALWEQQRKTADGSMLDTEEDTASATANGDGEEGGKKKSRKVVGFRPPEEAPAEKAQALIASVLQDAVSDLQRAAKAANDAAAESEVRMNDLAAAKEAQAGDGGAASSSSTVTAIAMASLAGRRSGKKKESAHKAYTIEPTIIPEDKFELPEVVKQREETVNSAAASKAFERERNRQAQEEAEQRKQRREKEKVRRREKAAQLQMEAAAKAKLAKIAAEVVADDVELSTEVTAAAAPDGAVAGSTESVAKSAATQHVAVTTAKTASVSKAPLPVAKAMAPRVAKRPVAAKRSVSRQIRVWWREHEFAVIMVLVAVVALLIALLYRDA